uniref:Uncharacterized protein n=1 Tax=Tanacetum cinerariifolium TaxID=118510 RepID=A0A6L2JG94_TANCI|nr:hypothetical protein [Tanacetum cinerariifolium]
MESSSSNSEEMELQQMQLEEVNALGFPNKCWQESFNDGTKWEPKNYKPILLRYLEELNKLIDERVLKYEELRVKESEACLPKDGIELNDNMGITESSRTESENSSSKTLVSISADEKRSSNKKSSSSEGNDVNADIGPSYDSNTMSEVPRDMFEKLIVHRI